MELKYYPGMIFLGDYFEKMIDIKMTATGMNMESFSELFHQKSEKVSKLLLIITIPFTAGILKLLFSKKRKIFL